MPSPIIEEGVRSHLRGRNRFLNIMTHDVVERLRIRRKALAADSGLDESYDVGTYPPDVTTVVMDKGRGWLPLVAGLLTGGLGTAGVAAALGAFGSAAPMAAPPAKAQVFDVTIESVDGKPKVTSVEVTE